MKRPRPFLSVALLTMFVALPHAAADDEKPALPPNVKLGIRIVDPATAATKIAVLKNEASKPEPPQPEPKVASHSQTSIIQTMHDGRPVRLNTFTLDGDGQILACVGPVAAADGASTGLLQVYSPEGKLVRETALEFTPTAVTAMPDGSVLTAGTGKLSRVSAGGEVLVTVDSPHVGDLDSLTDRIAAEAKEQMKTVTKRYADMIEGVKERMAALDEKSEEELTSRDEQMLKTLPKQLEMYEQTAARMEQTYSRIYSPEALLQRKLGVTSLAATNKDVFITTNAIEGRGYEVWRLDHELSSPKQIMTGLGGCCGQCDVQAAGDNIVIGENTRFQVSLVDRDGNRLSSFGKRDRSSVDGFGSCCNPMNVTCCSNGDIITSESTVGNIKRFSAKGEYLGLVGKAAISGGCKHVAVSFDEKRNRYYTMNIDKGHICVLAANPEPSAEASESEAEISEALPVPARRSQAVQTISIEIEK